MYYIRIIRPDTGHRGVSIESYDFESKGLALEFYKTLQPTTLQVIDLMGPTGFLQSLWRCGVSYWDGDLS
jgi:hypothetical protein